MTAGGVIVKRPSLKQLPNRSHARSKPQSEKNIDYCASPNYDGTFLEANITA